MWSDLTPPETAGRTAALAKAPAVISCTKPGRSRRQMVLLLIREAPAFWARGKTVAVAIGRDADRGKLRITPGGPFIIGAVAAGVRGKGKDKPTSQACLRLSPWAGVDRKHHPLEPVSYDYNDGWIEIDLPAWACVPTVASAPVIAHPAKGPFRIGAR